MNEYLKWVIDNYGYTCPKNKRLNYMEFVNCICKVYSMQVDRNYAAVNILGDNKQKYFLFKHDGSVEVTQ